MNWQKCKCKRIFCRLHLYIFSQVFLPLQISWVFKFQHGNLSRPPDLTTGPCSTGAFLTTTVLTPVVLSGSFTTGGIYNGLYHLCSKFGNILFLCIKNCILKSQNRESSYLFRVCFSSCELVYLKAQLQLFELMSENFKNFNFFFKFFQGISQTDFTRYMSKNCGEIFGYITLGLIGFIQVGL